MNCAHTNAIRNDWHCDSFGERINEMYCLDCDKEFVELDKN